MPGNFVGLALFVAFVTPGYVWIRVAEQRRPRPGRSQLLEAAELVSIGAVFTCVAVAILAVLGERCTWFLDVGAWLRASEPTKYLAEAAPQAALSFVGTMILGNTLAWGLARTAWGSWARAWRARAARSRATSGVLQVGTTVWYDLFGSVDMTRDRVAISLVQTDGTRIDGYLKAYAYSADGEEGDLALQRPIISTSPDGSSYASPADYVWLPGRSLRAVYALVEPNKRATAPTPST